MEDRRVGVAVDFSPCSKEALQWALSNLVRKGDNLILLYVQKEVHYEGSQTLVWEATGSPFIPLVDFAKPDNMKQYGLKMDEETIKMVTCAAHEKEITVLLKIYWGDPREKICEAVENIPLSCLIMGSRGLSKMKRVLLGSVSNHVVNTANCPVTVIKHEKVKASS